MKKLIVLTAIATVVLGSANTTFASNNVSNMATEKGGVAVAECAKEMDLGISECVTLTECQSDM